MRADTVVYGNHSRDVNIFVAVAVTKWLWHYVS